MSRRATGWVVALTGVGSLMAALDTLVVSTALSTIRLRLHASVEQLEWTVNAYNLSFAVLLITAAALGDRFGRRSDVRCRHRRSSSLASAACALAPSVGLLIAARAVQGAGAAFIVPLGLALLSAAFPPERRGAAIGIFSAITGLAVASGPLVGGAIVQGLDWEWIFWVNVPIGLVAIPLVLSRMRESHGPRVALDIRGLALVTLGRVRSRVGPRARQPGRLGQRRGARLAVASACRCSRASCVGAARRASRCCRCASSARERSRRATRRSSSPSRRCSGPCSSTRSCCRPASATDRSVPDLRLLPYTATFMTVAPIAGALADRIGERPLLVGGLTLQAVGMAWLALIAQPEPRLLADARAVHRRRRRASRWRSRRRRTRSWARSQARRSARPRASTA